MNLDCSCHRTYRRLSYASMSVPLPLIRLPFLDWQLLGKDCRSMLCAPILMSGAPLGALNIASPLPCAFSR